MEKEAIVFSDYWRAYQAVIPTAQLERWNNPLWQHLARFVRKTLPFYKWIKMHEIWFKTLLVG